MIKIWCTNCEGMVDFVIEPIHGANVNGKPSGDIVCKKCHLVIATVESDEPGIMEIKIIAK